MRTVRGLVVAMLMVATVLGVSTAEGASSDRVDPRGDLWEPHGFHGWDRADPVPNADLRRLTVRNRAHRIDIVATYANLRANDDESDLNLDLRTQRGRWTLSAQFNPFSPDGYFALGTVSDLVDCDLTGSVNYDREVLRVTVPQSCVHGARWLRYRGFHRRYNEEAGVWYDDVLSASHPSSEWSERVRRSAR